ncbi:MAG: invasin domain 3-containing protein [Armatimonadota bacterium]|nr:invasin domain 3-containing protein [Armatimonadota bacterium]
MNSLILILALLGLFLCSASTYAATSTIRLTATPYAIYADSRSVCSINAEVRDGSGNLVPDGSQVRFSTNLGVIDTMAATIGGVARAILRSGAQPGQAMVTAALMEGQTISQIGVEFFAPGAQIEADAFVSVSSTNYVAFATDSQTLDATGGCRVQHRGLVIAAHDVQVDVPRKTMLAKQKTGGEPIKLSRGAKSLAANVLIYNLSTQRGVMLTEGADGKMTKLAFDGADLSTTPIEGNPEQSSFRFQDLSQTRVLVKAREITIRPRKDVQFKRAEIFMEGGRIMKLPLYLIPLTGNPSRGPQYVSFTNSGVRVDVPLYYSLSPSGTGAVRIRNQQGSWSRYSSLPGWGVDLEQSYANGKADGRFTVGQVNRKDWGIDWQHSQQLAPDSKMNLYLGFPAHRDLFGMMNFNKSLSWSSIGLNLRGSKNKGQYGRLAGDLYIQTRPKDIIKGLNYSIALRSSISNERDRDYSFGNGLQLQLYANPITLGKRAALSSSLSVGRDWGKLNSGLNMYGNAMLTTPLGNNGSLALGYFYTLDTRLVGDYGHHRMTLNYSNYGSKLRGSLSSVYTLDQPIRSLDATIGYQFDPKWRFDVRGTYNFFGKTDPDGKDIIFRDLELGLTTLIGSQEVSLIWSRFLHRFLLEMGVGGF